MVGTITVGAPTSAGGFHEPSEQELAAYREQLFEFFDTEELEDAPEPVRRALVASN